MTHSGTTPNGPPEAPRTSTIPVKALLVLTAAVVFAHGLVLQGASARLQTSQSKVTRPFITRTVNLTPVAVVEPVAVPAVPPTALPRTPPPKPRAKPPVAPPIAVAGPGTDFTPISEVNTVVAPVEYAQAAINNAATEPAPPEPAASSPRPAASAAPAGASTATATARAAPTIAYTLPGSVRLKYNVAGAQGSLNYSARAELLWLQDGATYEARLEATLFLLGSRVRTSTGRLGAEGLLPTRFADKFRTELAAHFEREKQKITFSANTPDLPITPGMQDQLSIFVQLGAMLAGEPAKYPPGTTISFETVGPRSGETWVITVEGEEKLSLPGGELATVKLARRPRREFDQTAELWLAPALGYLPARIKITERNGDFVDQVWRATEAP